MLDTRETLGKCPSHKTNFRQCFYFCSQEGGEFRRKHLMPRACTELPWCQSFGHASVGSRAMFNSLLPRTGWSFCLPLPFPAPSRVPQHHPRRVLTGHLHELSQPSSPAENDPFDFCRASEQSQPLEESDKPGCPCKWARGGSREVAGSLYFCTRPAKTNSSPLTAALCEGRRRGRAGIPVRDCKNNSLCVCSHEVFAFEHLSLAQN